MSRARHRELRVPWGKGNAGTGVCGAPGGSPSGGAETELLPGSFGRSGVSACAGFCSSTHSDNALKKKIFPLNCLFLPDLKGSSGSLCVAKLKTLYIRKCSHLLTQPSLFVLLSLAPDVPPAMDKEGNSTSLEVWDALLLFLDIFISPIFPEAESYCA